MTGALEKLSKDLLLLAAAFVFAIALVSSHAYALSDPPSNLSKSFGNSINPRIMTSSDGVHVFAVWQDNTGPDGTSIVAPEIFFANSTDGGNSFSSPVNISNNAGVSTDPQLLAVANSTFVYVVWTDSTPGNNDILFAASSDGGKTFSLPVDLSSQNSQDSIHPSMAALPTGQVYVAWEDTSTTDGNSDIFVVNSTDFGNNFSSPVNISNNAGTSTNPQVSVSNSGKVYASWSDTTTSSQNSNIYFSSSTDGGRTFGGPINVSNDDGPAVIPRIATSENGKVYLAWQDASSGSSRILFSNSTDFGNSFGAPIDLSQDTASLNPSIAVSDKVGNDKHTNVYVAWEDASPSIGFSGRDILFASSTDGGVHFGASKNLSSNTRLSTSPTILPLPGTDKVYVGWKDNYLSITNDEVLLSSSSDAGSNFACPVDLTSDLIPSLSPSFALPPAGTVDVVWQGLNDPENQYSDIFKQSSIDPFSPIISIDTINDTQPYWNVSTISISGSLANAAPSDTVVIDWGDGKNSTGFPITSCSWGPLTHRYDASAITLNPVKISAQILDSTNFEKAHSSLDASVNIQPHTSFIQLDPVTSVQPGGKLIVTGTLFDQSDPATSPIIGMNITFDGTGTAADNATLPLTRSLENGTFKSVGIAPNSFGKGWQIQAHFVPPQDDPRYAAFDSDILTFDTIDSSAVQFPVFAGANSTVDMSGFFGYSASITFSNVTADGTMFAIDCTSDPPTSFRYKSLECIEILPSVQTGQNSYALLNVSYSGLLPFSQINSESQIDIFHKDSVSNLVTDLTQSRALTSHSIVANTTSFGTFVIGFALHSPASADSHRQQVFLGSNTVGLRNINDKTNSTTTVSFDKSSYHIGDVATVILNDVNGNVDSQRADVITAAVKSTSSSPEMIFLTLTETGPSTGKFEGHFTLTSGLTSNENGQLHVSIGDVFSVYSISGARIAAKVQPITEAGLVQFRDIITDSSVCFKPVGGAVDMEFVDTAIKSPDGNITITISYANAKLGANPASSLTMYHKEGATWNNIGSVSHVSVNTTSMTVTASTNTPGGFSLGFDVGCGGGAGGGLGGPGPGVVLDFVASIAAENSGSSSSGQGGVSGGGGAAEPGSDVTTYPSSYFAANPTSRIVLYPVQFGTNSASPGSPSSTQNPEIKNGQPINLTVQFKNYVQQPQKFAMVIVVTDKNEFTTDISWQSGTVDAGKTIALSKSFTLTSQGTFNLKVFVLDSIDVPSVLSQSQQQVINVI